MPPARHWAGVAGALGQDKGAHILGLTRCTLAVASDKPAWTVACVCSGQLTCVLYSLVVLAWSEICLVVLCRQVCICLLLHMSLRSSAAQRHCRNDPHQNMQPALVPALFTYTYVLSSMHSLISCPPQGPGTCSVWLPKLAVCAYVRTKQGDYLFVLWMKSEHMFVLKLATPNL